MEDTEIPGSYRWIFAGGPRNGEMTLNESGAPGTIDGDAHHIYQLQPSPEYAPDMTTAPDVLICHYEWIEIEEGVEETGGSWN